jgi:hypothetical protein
MTLNWMTGLFGHLIIEIIITIIETGINAVNVIDLMSSSGKKSNSALHVYKSV